MSYIPEIPNNSLTENLKKLVQLTQQLNDEYSFYYSPPLSETEISEIERTNNISLPSSYKEWLMFSNEATICGVKCSPFVRQCGIIEIYQNEV